MRRFIITSVHFTGKAEIIYKPTGVLFRIDCLETNMDETVIANFKRAVPSSLNDLLEGKGFSAGTSITEASYRISFDQFWNSYSKKINKGRCSPLWENLSDGDTVLAWLGIKPYDMFLAKQNNRKKLDP